MKTSSRQWHGWIWSSGEKTELGVYTQYLHTYVYTLGSHQHEKFYHDDHGVQFWGHLSCLVFSELPGSVVLMSAINLGPFCHYCFKYFFVFFFFPSFFSLLVFPLYEYYEYFCSCPMVPGYSVLFFPVLVLFAFLSGNTLKLRDSLLSRM